MNPPRRTIALFQPAEADYGALAAALHRRHYTVVTITDAAELSPFYEQVEAPLAAIVVPLKLASGASGIPLCLHVRTSEHSAPTPIIGLSTSRESAILNSFYGAGADIVFTTPIEPEHLLLQIEALSRQRRHVDEQLRSLGQSSGIKKSIYEAFNAVREGVLVFSTARDLVFLNSPARRLLGAAPHAPVGELGAIESHLAAYLPSSPVHNAAPEIRAVVPRLDGRRTTLGIRIAPLSGADESPAGFAMALTDLNELAHLAAILEQDQRTRSLALLSAAGAARLLADQGGAAHSIVPQIESLLSRSTPHTQLAPALTALLEILDAVLNPGATLKVNAVDDASIAAPLADLFQLIGHVVLHSVARAGIGGETVLAAVRRGAYIELTVSSKPSPFGSSSSPDALARLIRGTWGERSANTEPTAQPQPDFEAARAIAHRSGIVLKERGSPDGATAYTMLLPIHG